jgi:hydroxymethylglutaryl-CoA lyase
MAQRVTVHEVGPRDGLQNEARHLSTAGKQELLRALAGAGLRHIEATSFVSPRWIPQLADADEIVRTLPDVPGMSYDVLVPNARGMLRLLAALAARPPSTSRVDAAIFVSASESHNRRNLNRTTEETLRGFEEVMELARARAVSVRGYVSTAFGCPFEGAIDPRRVEEVARRLVELGCEQVSLGDTIGVGTPNQVRRLVNILLRTLAPERLALHLHDTRGTALANVLAGLDSGVVSFDASIGGLGGCPYAPGASGNLATEDLVYMLRGMGYETGIDWDRLLAAGELAQLLVGRPLPGRALQAELARKAGGAARK